MRKCSEDCMPCCDFCKFVVHAIAEDGSKCEPLGCYKHQDYKHQQEVDSCGSCDDFECFRCEPTNADHIRSMSDEELAEFFLDVSSGHCDRCLLDKCDGDDCAKSHLNWLKQSWEDKP